MNLKTTPFSDYENKKDYDMSSFNELGMNVTILNEITQYNKIPSGNFYKFGAVINGEYNWYFNAIAVADSREKMREIYSAILQVNAGTQNQPFIYKVKRK
jgi:acetone carboxylase gamma subunit